MRTCTRVLSVLTAASLTLSLLSFSALAVEGDAEPSHLPECGAVCTHTEHDETCGYTPGNDAVDCTNDPCTGEEDEHVEHQDAVSGTDCGHIHDDICQVWVCAAGCPVAAEAESQSKIDAVIEAIGALPGSVNYDDRDVIYAAKALFNALTEDEQAQVTNADVLAAALDAWKSTLRGERTQAVDGGHTSQGITYIITYESYKDKQTYTQEQVDAMTPDEIKALRLFISTISYTIPENFEGSTLTLALTDAVIDALDYTTYMPGSAAPCKFEVINLSSHSYAYQNKSFYVSTEDYSAYYDKGWATPTDVTGFDGQLIPQEYLTLRTASPAMVDFFDGKKPTAAQVTDEALATQLALKGYGTLADAFLAYMNKTYQTDYTQFESFNDEQLWSGILRGTKYSNSLVETDPVLQALGYNYFYNHLFSVAPGGASDPTGANDYTVGTLIRNYHAGIASGFEPALSSAFGDITPYSEQENGNAYLWGGFELWSHAKHMDNPYQGYNYGIASGLTLTRTDDTEPEPPVDPPTPPTPDYYYVTVKYVEEATGKELHSRYRTDSIREGRDYNVTSEAALAIDGYAIVRVDGATSGTLRRNLTITVYYAADDTEIIDPAPPTTDKPETDPAEPEVDLPDTAPPLTDLPDLSGQDETVILPETPPLGNLPQTGTLSESNVLFLTLASLSAALSAGLLVLTLSSRKKEEK